MVTSILTAAEIEALTPSDIVALQAGGVTAVTASDASVWLTVAQAVAFEDTSISLSAPTDCFIHVADGGTAIDGMTPAQIGALSTYGITAIEVAGPTTVSGLVLGSSHLIVEDGGTALSTTVTGGGHEIVLGSGSTVSGTVLSSGAFENLSAGGVASGTVVSGGAFEDVASGGVAFFTTVSSGGQDWVSAGGSAGSATVENGGTQYVFGGVAIGGTVTDGGSVLVGTLGAAISTVASGGNVFILSGGMAGYSLVEAGGAEDVQSGGSSIYTVVTDFGTQTVAFGGTTVSAQISATGTQTVEGVASLTWLSTGGVETVSSGGEAFATVLTGGVEFIFSGGTASNNAVWGGGTQTVAFGGEADWTYVSSGGTEVVSSGGVTSDTVLLGGVERLSAGATASVTVVLNGGTQVVGSGGESIGGVVGSGGVLAVTGGASVGGAHLDTGGSIDFTDIRFDGAGLVTVDSTAHLLTLTDGKASESIGLDPNQSFGGATFTVAADGDLGTDVTLTSVVCFAAGTRILTPAGEQAVETLAPGEVVMTVDGEAKPITWLGRQTVARRFADPLRVLPIRIVAGALGEDLPVRDLLLSPCHALLLGGVLIQAGALVNGTTIRREHAVPEIFTYYHVELEDHGLILAEGVPAETFVDNVDRMNFDNWDEYLARWPEGREIEEMPLPRAKSARQVPPHVRAQLAARAARALTTAA